MSGAARRRLLWWDAGCPPHLVVPAMVLRWVHSGSCWRARIVYALVVWQVVGLFVLAVAGPALAQPTNPPPEPSDPNPADTSMFGWINVEDSSGIPISKYFIAVDQGNAFSLVGVNTDKKPNIALAPILELEYGLFKITCQFGLWTIGYGLSLKWMDFIATPFGKLGDATENLTHGVGLLALALTLAGGVAAFWLMRGRTSRAAYQVGSAVVITTLMATVLSQPVAALVGSDGYLAKARDVGVSIADGITRGGSSSPAGSAPSITELQTTLADGFVRRPTQILNFNAQADTNGCKTVWNNGIRSGDRDKLRDAIAKCGTAGKAMKFAADHLTGDRLASAAFMLVLSVILLAFGCYLIGKIILAVVVALSQAIMLPIVGTLGVVAGGLQGTAFKCLCSIGFALIKIPLTVVYAGAYAALLRSMLDVDGNPIQVLVLSTVLLVVAIIAFRRIEAGLRNRSGAVLNFLNRSGGSAELPPAGFSPLMRRGTALAMQAGGAALGVPPTVTGLAVAAARSVGRPHREPSGAHLAAADHNPYDQNTALPEGYPIQVPQQLIGGGDSTGGQQQAHPDAGVEAGLSGAAAPDAPAVQGVPHSGAPRVTDVLQQAPPLHPDVAAALAAMPQQIQPAASLPPITVTPPTAPPPPPHPPRASTNSARPAAPRPPATAPRSAPRPARTGTRSPVADALRDHHRDTPR